MMGVIVSDPESGMKSFGLTPHERQQVLEVSDMSNMVVNTSIIERLSVNLSARRP